MNATRKLFWSAVAAAALTLPSAAPAKQSGSDWLWLTASLTGCTWTVTVQWAGFRDAKYLEVFTTEGYAGAPLLSTLVPIKNKETTATVTLPPLVDSTTWTLFYPWAQLVDAHGNAIPASLDFSGGNFGYCAAP